MNTRTNACPITIMTSYGEIRRFCAAAVSMKFHENVDDDNITLNFNFVDSYGEEDVMASHIMSREQYNAMCNAMSIEPNDMDAATLALTYQICGSTNGILPVNISSAYLRNLNGYANMAFRANVKAMWRIYYIVE